MVQRAQGPPSRTEGLMQTILSQVTALTERYRRAALPFVALAILLPWLLFAGFAVYDYRVETDRARAQVTTTTDALAEHAQTVVETADLVLARVLDHIQPLDWGTISESPDIHAFLLSLKRELPQVESVFVVAPDGTNAASSRAFPLPHITDTHREYFQRALQGERRPMVSAPFAGQIAGTTAFTITRPRLRDGRFDGLAGVTISPRYFEGLYRAVLAHTDVSVASLVRDDGVQLVRYPALPDGIVTLPPDSPLMQAIASGAPNGMFRGVATTDQRDRVSAFKRLQNWPLLVMFGIEHRFVLRNWYFHIALMGVSTVLLTAALLYAARIMLRTARQEQEALRRLVEETSRRQQAEAALAQAQKLEALGRLTGGVAHDFNNLLAAILGCVELLQRQVSGERPQRLLATARQAAERGARLTAQMLAFARRKELTVRPVNVTATIRDLHDLLEKATGPSVTIAYDVADDLGLAMADGGQLEIALLNLAVNARDAMPQGGRLTLAARTVMVGPSAEDVSGLSPGRYIRISVTDTGEGMTEEVRARAFEPFFTTKGPGKGTGLGLSMVFGFASLVAGTVTIDSAPGQGTTISIYMPCAAATADLDALPALAPRPALGPSPRRRILLIDDDADVLATAQVMLESLGHDVVAADGGAAALSRLRTDRRFDLIIIDFAMPTMNGSEFAAELRRLWPEAPLLFVTGYVENDALRPWQDLGVQTLNKPYTQTELAAAVDLAIDRSAATARVIPLRAR